MNWKATAENDEMYARLKEILGEHGQHAVLDEPRRTATFDTRDESVLAAVVETGCFVESED